jgi:hypothetical protein
MPGGLDVAARAGTKMQARETYRTIDRMERRRGYLRSASSGTEDDEQPREQRAPRTAPSATTAPAPPAYTDELMAIAQLHAKGVLTPEEYEAKKKQLLGI